MMRRIWVAATAAAALLCGPASANDGFGGLTATGLQFDKTGVVQMLSEDLYISLKQVRVAYIFRHRGGADVTGEVIFPLPPVNLMSLRESDFAIDPDTLDKPNFVHFTVTVDGRAVPVKTDRIAVIEPDYDENRPISEVYTAPGRDVTAVLEKYGIPLSLRPETVGAVLAKLPKAAKDDLAAQGIIEVYEGAENGADPRWSIVERYHWTQTFAAGRDVKIAHSYDGAFPGGVFGWNAVTEPDSWQANLTKTYCIDGGTQKAIRKALRKSDGEESWYGMAYYIDYVLTTAKTWAGPIGDFRLTIDKGDPRNVISLCVDGIKKTGPTTFVVEKKDFVPDRDLSILLVPSVDTMPQ
ncbi:MAG: DUF4424 family protein [Alphaproteobacteria bacterium]|nr:DUF4424 family protein [Alphaproteobacteria bacterium]